MKQRRIDCRRWSAERFVGTDAAVLRGEDAAIVYGCCRILKYEKTRICLLRRQDRICVHGEDLLCTAFSVGTVTVEGTVVGLRFCRERCETCGEVGR